MPKKEVNTKEVLKKAKMEDDEYKDVSGEKNYYSIAHTIKEVVIEQASIMVNGSLKEYQVKVRYNNILIVLVNEDKKYTAIFGYRF